MRVTHLNFTPSYLHLLTRIACQKTSRHFACSVSNACTNAGSVSSWLSFDSLRYSIEPEGQLSWGSYCLYACGFRVYFTPLPGFFSPFPHGTGSLSVDYEYLALEDGPPMFRQDSTCPALLLVRLVPQIPFRIRDYHPLWPAFPCRFARTFAKSHWLIRVRSPLLPESRLISVPPPT